MRRIEDAAYTVQLICKSQSIRVFTKPTDVLREQAAPGILHWEKQMKAALTKSALALTLTTAIAWTAAPAHADRIEGVTVSSAPTLRVSYAELDINKPRGLEVLYGRIQRAAKIVCGYDFSPQELARARQAKACYNDAIDDAVRQINRPTLTAFHRAKTRSTMG
jgi:UrcA family protein